MEGKIRVGDAGGKGKGVFAKVRIPKGEVVMIFSGREMWIWEIPRELWDYAFQVGYDRYVLPRRNSCCWFLNHSCIPNCGISGRRRIVALRDIAKLEEVTIDYSANVGWDGFAMKCLCGEKNCRGVVRSYEFLEDETKERYGKYVSSYLLTSKKGRRVGGKVPRHPM